ENPELGSGLSARIWEAAAYGAAATLRDLRCNRAVITVECSSITNRENKLLDVPWRCPRPYSV
ncbi:hypothetical protein HAX54_036018, partial [Datura stramonium]|nr:hypothetical protein [Datura stramonium]